MTDELHVTQYATGSGAGTLVLLHGFPVDHRMWDACAQYIDPEWRVLGVDLPGLGRSAHTLPTDTTMDRSATHVFRAIRAYTSEPVVLAGLSMGGYVAQAALNLFSKDIHGLILLDTRSQADTETAVENRLRIAEQALREGSSAVVLGMASATLSPETVAVRSEIVAYMRGLIESQTPQGIAWSQRAMACRADSSETLAQWEKPSLLIVGEDDEISPAEVMADIAATMPNARLEKIPHAGHMAPVEQPRAVAHAINTYLGTL
ncbi:alpha/beta fold hydrolase [Timonella sp. A28]|uniref:alpha/beta fold hydrolase n=1 Tax=Timonella sp. A28 TaxID=3442640 RepID=UPI003EB974C0